MKGKDGGNAVALGTTPHELRLSFESGDEE